MAKRHRSDKIIPMPFTKGVDAGTDPKITPAFTQLENVSVSRLGAFSRRNPTKAMGSTVSNTAIGQFNDRPFLYGAADLESWDENTLTDATGAWENTAQVDPEGASIYPSGVFLDVDHEATFGKKGKICNVSHIYLGDFLAIGYQVYTMSPSYVFASSDTYIMLYNRYSGVLYDSLNFRSDYTESRINVRFFTHGNYIVAVGAKAGDTLGTSYIDTSSTLTWSTVTAIASTPLSSTGNQLVDVCSFGTSTTSWACAYINSSDNAVVIELSLSGSTVTSNGQSSVSGTFTEIAICPWGTTDIAIVYNDASNLYGKGINNTPTDTVTAVSLSNGTGPKSGLGCVQGIFTSMDALMGASENGIWVTYNMCATTTDSACYGVQFYDNGGTGTAITDSDTNCLGYNMSIYSKPFVFDSKLYVWALYQDIGAKQGLDDGSYYDGIDYGQRLLVLLSSQTNIPFTYQEVDVVSPQPVPYARAIIGQAGGYTNRSADTTWLQMAPVEVTVDGSAGFTCFGVRNINDANSVITKLYITPDTPQAITTPKGTVLTGSVVYEWDGVWLRESGFFNFPTGLTLSDGGSSSDVGLGEGSYGYRECYKHIDALGNIIRSAPGPVATVAIAADGYEADLDTFDIGGPNGHAGDYTRELYRTLKDGNLYYLVGESIITSDGMSDSQLATHEQLYTTGGALENIQPPASRCGAVFQNRVFLVNREDESTSIRYSRKFADNLGIQHSDTLIIKCSPDGGRIYALAGMDDKLYIMKKDRIYVSYGQGLNDIGGGQAYATPVLVSNAIGCINRDSVVRIPEGLMFESDNGIVLLTRSGEIKHIGEPVKYWYDQMTLSAAVHHKTKSEAIFFDSSSTARCLVYNYKFQTWTTHTNFRADSAEIIDDKIVYIQGSGVRIEDSSLGQDDTGDMSMIIETGWSSPAGLGGWQRVRNLLLLGQNIADSTITVKTQYDFTPIWEDTQTFATSGLENFDYTKHFGVDNATNANQAMLLKVVLSQQKCTAVRFQITITSTGLGVDLTAMAVVVDRKPGKVRMEGNRRL